MGKTTEQAFYVGCDEISNPSEDKLIIEVGVAIENPAEFITFKIIHDLGQS